DEVWDGMDRDVPDDITNRKSTLKARIADKVQRRRKRRIRWQLGTAAALVLSIATTGYLLMRPATPAPVAYGLNDALVEEVDPGSDKAVLVLPDGKKVVLDQSLGETTIQGNDLV